MYISYLLGLWEVWLSVKLINATPSLYQKLQLEDALMVL